MRAEATIDVAPEIRTLQADALDPAHYARDPWPWPVLIRGLLGDRERWRPRRLLDVLGDAELPVEVYGGACFARPGEPLPPREMRAVTYRGYLEQLADGTARREGAYLAQVPLAGRTIDVELADVFDRVICGATVGQRHRFFWLGPAGYHGHLHYDRASNILLQLHGDKRAVLFAPEHGADLYPFGPGGSLPTHFSQVNVTRPDLRAFPRLARALPAALSVDVGPGDALYLPPLWWHAVSSRGDGAACSVNQFFWHRAPGGGNCSPWWPRARR